MSEPAHQYITSQELADLIKPDKKLLEDFAIIDVRDKDFAGGNIVGCLRSPSEKYKRSVDELIEKTKDIPKMIFHCSFSQQRGPKAAKIYAEKWAARGEESKLTKEILVLEGGFSGFQLTFKNDPKLVEKWQNDVWDTNWS
ncbi:hypothetical protein FRB93_009728 [Tulasnella sp. JGI-2019a]|nr:hypothetical protein FRB93_009728 [Tulasnella sp. JGI-2019a]